MDARKFSNNASTTLVADSGSTIQVTSTSTFPNTYPFYLTLENNALTREIVRVNSLVSTNIYNVTRAQENTTQVAFASGDKVDLRITAGTLNGLITDKLENTNPFIYGTLKVSDTTNSTSIDTVRIVGKTDGGSIAINTSAGAQIAEIKASSTAGVVNFDTSVGYVQFSNSPRSSIDATTSDGLLRKGQFDTELYGRLLNVQTWKTAGTYTYTPTTGTKYVIIEICGGGGAGGYSNASGFVGTGGGGGSFIRELRKSSADFSGGTVVVGAGGDSGTTFSNGGGTSSFKTSTNTKTSQAYGGGGGQNTAGDTQRTGAYSSFVFPYADSNVITLNTAIGGPGGNAYSISGVLISGTGGTSLYSTAGGLGGVPGGSLVGKPGTGPGAGGGGSIYNTPSSTPYAGGAGIAGQVTIYEYI